MYDLISTEPVNLGVCSRCEAVVVVTEFKVYSPDYHGPKIWENERHDHWHDEIDRREEELANLIIKRTS